MDTHHMLIAIDDSKSSERAIAQVAHKIEERVEAALDAAATAFLENTG